jgi:hypothetical protein
MAVLFKLFELFVVFRPGSDSYAYENPWPKLNKGRLDWLFQDGWRRPLAKDQGARLVSHLCNFSSLIFDLFQTLGLYCLVLATLVDLVFTSVA